MTSGSLCNFETFGNNIISIKGIKSIETDYLNKNQNRFTQNWFHIVRRSSVIHLISPKLSTCLAKAVTARNVPVIYIRTK